MKHFKVMHVYQVAVDEDEVAEVPDLADAGPPDESEEGVHRHSTGHAAEAKPELLQLVEVWPIRHQERLKVLKKKQERKRSEKSKEIIIGERRLLLICM